MPSDASTRPPATRQEPYRNPCVPAPLALGRQPDEFYELVESLCIGRKLDYFSREPRPGWEQFGVEADKFGGAA